MVDIKRATANAIDFATSALGPDRTVAIRLEEIESSVVDGREVWLITLSSALSSPFDTSMTGLRAVIGAEVPREYKVFTVAKDTGEVLSMKIRLLTAPGA